MCFVILTFVRPNISRTTMQATNKCNKFCMLIFLLKYFNLLYMCRATKLAHLQEHFLNVYTALAAISVHCTKAIYTVKKCSWRWVSFLPETCRADSNSSIKRSINAICCIFLAAYVGVLWFSLPTFIWNISNFKTKLARYDRKYVSVFM